MRGNARLNALALLAAMKHTSVLAAQFTKLAMLFAKRKAVFALQWSLAHLK